MYKKKKLTTEDLYNDYYQKLPDNLKGLFKQKLGEGPEAVQKRWLPALEKISEKIDDVNEAKKANPADLENAVNSALKKYSPKSIFREAFPYVAAAGFAGALLYVL